MALFSSSVSGGGFPTDAAHSPNKLSEDAQEKLGKLVDEFNKLMDEHRYAEAELIVKRAAELAPDALVVVQLKNTVKMVKRTRDVAALRHRKENAYYQSLQSVEESADPFNDQKLNVGGDAKRWETKSTAFPPPGQLRDLQPRNLTTAQGVTTGMGQNGTAELDVIMRGYVGDTNRLRDARHKGFYDGLYQQDFEPNLGPRVRQIRDEPPILFPDAEVWKTLTEKRKRYKVHLDRLEQASKRGAITEREINEARAALREIDAIQSAMRSADDGHGPGLAGDRYARILENPFLDVTDNPLSTFSIDIDTASYAKTRRYVEQEGRLPPPDAVRIEELVNYFTYDYAPPEGDVPFSAHVEVAACPWQPEHRLLRIGLKGKEIPADDRPAANLVFLLDVSGSMQPDDKLPRVRRAMHLLVEQLREQDRVAIVVYAAGSGLVLPSTSGFQQRQIAAALDALEAGGSTNGGDGIRLAYDTAQAGFIKGGTNRVILCTDGDFNVGTTSTAELERLVEERAKGGVFLTVLGFGMGNHNDEMMEKLADKGNGNYGYVDSDDEARKLLVEQAGGTLVTIAKDVKLQLEFNPLAVAAYRLIGYEDRLLRAEDFNDNKKDAGEIGAGHTVTALYELAPPGKPVETPEVDELKYQRRAAPTEAAASGELLTLKLRYKDPDGQTSHEPLVVPASDAGHGFAQATADFKFASAVASFGLLLRDSQFKGNLTYAAVLELAGEGLGADPHGHRAAFVELVKKAKAIADAP